MNGRCLQDELIRFDDDVGDHAGNLSVGASDDDAADFGVVPELDAVVGCQAVQI